MSVEEIARTITNEQTGFLATVIIAVVSGLSYVLLNAIKHWIDKQTQKQTEKIVKNGHDSLQTKMVTKRIGMVNVVEEVEEPGTLEERLGLKIEESIIKAQNIVNKNINDVKGKINDIKSDVIEVKSDMIDVKEDISDLRNDLDEHVLFAKKSDKSLNKLKDRMNKINGFDKSKVTRARNRRIVRDEKKSSLRKVK